jgi:hypothetical protein
MLLLTWICGESRRLAELTGLIQYSTVLSYLKWKCISSE